MVTAILSVSRRFAIILGVRTLFVVVVPFRAAGSMVCPAAGEIGTAPRS
jgi:hypothetical protein